MGYALLLYPYLRHYHWDSIHDNHDQPKGGTGEEDFPQSFTHFSPLRPVKRAFEVLNSLWMLRKSYFCQVSLVHSM